MKTVWCKKCYKLKGNSGVLKKFDIKNQLYEKCSPSIEEIISIESLAKKTKEIDYLKYLILNKEQILAFEFLEKPTIIATNNEMSISRNMHEDITNTIFSLSKEKKLESVILYCKEVKSKNEAKMEERKLLDIMDEEIKNLI